MKNENLCWGTSDEMKPKLSKINRSKYSKLLPTAACVIIVGAILIVPGDVGFKGIGFPIIVITIFFTFLYWYFGSTKFLPRECIANITDENLDVSVDGWPFHNPKIEIIERINDEVIIKLHGRPTMTISAPKELIVEFEKRNLVILRPNKA